MIWSDNKKTDKKEIFACGNDGTIRIFDAIHGGLLWFKRYSDKIRCISYLNSINGPFIICGGDDKCLHIINKNTREDFKRIKFENYVWKCLSYPPSNPNRTLISSYSFVYFNNSISIDKIEFTSKLLRLDEDFNILWKLHNKNIEILNIIERNEKIFVVLGTTLGALLILDERKGEIVFKDKKSSCLNSIKSYLEKNLMLTSYDNGQIFAYFLEI